MKSTRVYFLFLVLSAMPLLAYCQNEITGLLQQAETQLDEQDEQAALETYESILDLDNTNYDALWNASLLYSSIGFRLGNEGLQKEYFDRAAELAEKGLEHHPGKGYPFYVMAVAKGRMAGVVGVRKRIALGHQIEEYISQAVDLLPNHAPSWHLYGVWQSEVANVSRVERMAARFLSGGLPEASDEKAEEYLKKAMELAPESILIRVDLARHYERSGQPDRMIAVLEELFQMDLEPQTKDDPRHLDDARQLLQKLR